MSDIKTNSKISNMNSKILQIVYLSFTVYFIVDTLYFNFIRSSLNDAIQNVGISHNISYLIFGIPRKKFFISLGLSGSFIKALLFSLICTAPMFIGFFLLFSFNNELTINEFLISGIAAAFFEELYFRGFLFGIPFKFTRLGFVLSIIVGAILFAVVHLYQSQDLYTLIGIFFTTFFGALIFGWTYVEWKFNLWVPITLHFLMNLSWMLFSVSDNALGDTYANIIRIVTIVLIFLITILYKKRKGLPFYINRKTLFILRDKTSINH